MNKNLSRNKNKKVASNFELDKYGNVYDDEGYYYIKWFSLNEENQETIKQNPKNLAVYNEYYV